MRAQIIKIGNSQGIRIPKVLLERAGLKGEVEMEVRNDQIIIYSPQQPRQSWEEAFRELAQQGDDKLIDPDLTGRGHWDKSEWEW